ncbi:MAG TPA: DUF2868 domain-containing protein [Oligoflexus sp.]|uniref:DUF2868 domain-containing protein n=1 Tax=Oligoflexus sp. TaxID=1971216 RepID=UPI002D229071|nr:DUF2868 domain-containing protein [Oligoflexus sp.]HYX31818.1 DUF2868 domain-containing protein [Oligoflexus sp.]
MPGYKNRVFTLADVIDYELQMALDGRAGPEELIRRDSSLRLDGEVLKKGKTIGLKVWLDRIRGPFGERFVQLRQLLSLGVSVLGALLGWATIRGLLTYDGQHPVNVLPFLVFFVLLPFFFLTVLFLKGAVARVLGRLPTGWVSQSGLWLLSRVMKKSQVDLPALDLWHRLQSRHPRIFTWQAWVLSQTFGLVYYLTALGAFLFYVSVHDYKFAWQTTLRIGPQALENLVGWIALPFAWAGPLLVPHSSLIEATQYDRFSGTFVQAQGSALAADWWPFLAAAIVVYGCLPRAVLLLVFQIRLHRHLQRIVFDDFASEGVWLRLQGLGLGWEGTQGTTEAVIQAMPEPERLRSDQPLLVVRWRQAPFQDDELQTYFSEHGYKVGRIVDAEGRESEFRMILEALQSGQALALVCDPWELPGEAFNRLRVAMREKLGTRTPIFLVPLQQGPEGSSIHATGRDRSLWEASLKTFRDPYVGFLFDRRQPS